MTDTQWMPLAEADAALRAQAGYEYTSRQHLLKWLAAGRLPSRADRFIGQEFPPAVPAPSPPQPNENGVYPIGAPRTIADLVNAMRRNEPIPIPAWGIFATWSQYGAGHPSAIWSAPFWTGGALQVPEPAQGKQGAFHGVRVDADAFYLLSGVEPPAATPVVSTDEHAPPVSNQRGKGRPPKWQQSLSIFLERLAAGDALSGRTDEARAIVKAWRVADPPKPETVVGYIKPFMDAAKVQDGRIANRADLMRMVEADLNQPSDQ